MSVSARRGASGSIGRWPAARTAASASSGSSAHCSRLLSHGGRKPTDPPRPLCVEDPSMAMLTAARARTLVPPGTWDVDPARSTVGFDVRHLMVTKVHGRFGDLLGTIRCNSNGAGSIDGRVAAESIDTGDHRRHPRPAPRSSSTSSTTRLSALRHSARPSARAHVDRARHAGGTRHIGAAFDHQAACPERGRRINPRRPHRRRSKGGVDQREACRLKAARAGRCRRRQPLL
jgi:YceI-like domain